MAISITTRGPLFNGTAHRLVDAMCDEIELDVAESGAEQVVAWLGEVLKHPTPYYQTRIQHQAVDGHQDINDGGIVYGPWLEGVGSRNKETRFKGYATFRRVTQSLDQRAEGIAHRVVVPYIREMG